MLNSIIPFFAAHGLLGYGLAYLDPVSMLRPFVLVLIMICCFISVHGELFKQVPGSIGCDYAVGLALHASFLLVWSIDFSIC